MRSSAGVGTTPPKVLGAPNPLSSVMMSSTLGAPLGGTMRGAHQAFESDAFSLMIPPNFGSGGGSCLPLMVVVAPGDPGTPVICWADARPDQPMVAIADSASPRNCLFIAYSNGRISRYGEALLQAFFEFPGTFPVCASE
jgi:hypothetical protein